MRGREGGTARGREGERERGTTVDTDTDAWRNNKNIIPDTCRMQMHTFIHTPASAVSKCPRGAVSNEPSYTITI